MTPEELREQIAEALLMPVKERWNRPGEPMTEFAARVIDTQVSQILAVVTPALAQAREDGAQEALREFEQWHQRLAEKHPRFAAQSFLVRAQIERFTTDHYPEKEQTDG